MTELPLIGACLCLPELEELQDFILAENRDLELQDFCDVDLLNGDWRAVADRIKALLAGYDGRLGLHGPFWGLSIASPDPDLRAVNRRKYLQGLEICDYLGATQMVIHSPYTTWDCYNLDAAPNRAGHDRVIRNCHETLASVVKRAEETGVTLVIENIEDKHPDLRRNLAESFGSAHVALSVDTGHAHYAHGATGAPPVDYFIRDAGTRLAHVHLQDADGYADRHWALGEGTIGWAGVFRALGGISGRPRLLLELADAKGMIPSVAYLKALGLGR